MRTPVLLVGWVHVSHSTGLPLPKMPRIYQLHMGHMAQYYGEIIFGKQLLGYSPNDTNILPLKVPESFFQTGNLWGCWKGSAQVKLRKYVLYTHNICVNISMHTHPCLKDTISKINIYIYMHRIHLKGICSIQVMWGWDCNVGWKGCFGPAKSPPSFAEGWSDKPRRWSSCLTKHTNGDRCLDGISGEVLELNWTFHEDSLWKAD